MLYNISHHVPEPTCTKLPFVRSSIPKPYSIDARIITSEDQPLVEMLDKIVMHPHAPLKLKKKCLQYVERGLHMGCYSLGISKVTLVSSSVPLHPSHHEIQGSTWPLCKSRTGRIKRPGPKKRKRPVKSFPEARHVEPCWAAIVHLFQCERWSIQFWRCCLPLLRSKSCALLCQTYWHTVHFWLTHPHSTSYCPHLARKASQSSQAASVHDAKPGQSGNAMFFSARKNSLIRLFLLA